MYLSHITIMNYRNFRSFDAAVRRHTVIIGGNKAGKSNLFKALRLVLDPNMSAPARKLQDTDFWDSGEVSPFDGRTIKVEAVLTLDEEDLSFASICQLQIGEGNTVKFTYKYEPQPLSFIQDEDIPDGTIRIFHPSEYQVLWYTGDDPRFEVNTNKLSNFLTFRILDALRDTEDLLSTWSRSPLKSILQGADIDRDFLKNTANNVRSSAEPLIRRGEITDLVESIEKRSLDMVGEVFSVGSSLNIVTDEPDDLLRSMKLYVDGSKQRPLHQASLGTLNVLYFSLLLEEMRQKYIYEQKALQAKQKRTNSAQPLMDLGVQSVENVREQRVILAVEEPEAHIHPHVQRSIFRYFLSSESSVKSLLVSTHSPYIASVIADIHSILLLQQVLAERGTEASQVQPGLFSESENLDLIRYLDATKGEMLFARGVILVEGTAEQFLVPAFAKAQNINLDHLGISVVPVQGTDFTPYVKLLSTLALNIPFVVITDGDRNPTLLDDEDEVPLNESGAGENRGRRLLEILSEEEINENTPLATFGIFVGDITLEVDMLGYYEDEIIAAYKEVESSKKKGDRFEEAIFLAKSGDVADYLKRITRIGKGRFAQILSAYVDGTRCPTYINDALLMIANKCSNNQS